MAKSLEQMAKEAAVEKFRTSRDQEAAKIAENYFKYGGKAVIREIERVINTRVFPEGDDTIPRFDRIVALIAELKRTEV